MVASQLNHQINSLLKRPQTHYWTSPLNDGTVTLKSPFTLYFSSPPPPPRWQQASWRQDAARGQEVYDNEEEGVAYSYTFFHIMLMLASFYIMMTSLAGSSE